MGNQVEKKSSKNLQLLIVFAMATAAGLLTEAPFILFLGFLCQRNLAKSSLTPS